MISHILFLFLCSLTLCCGGFLPPPIWQKNETARWLAHANIWGTLSTISLHLDGQAWGQPKSFVDGTVKNSTGNFYFYDSEMDTSLQDIAANSNVSFSLSAAQLGLCPPKLLDPENPLCSRMVVSGQFTNVTDNDELEFAMDALFERHPTMKRWPEDHSWGVYKIELTDIWLINVFGGASIIEVDDYFAVDMNKVKMITNYLRRK